MTRLLRDWGFSFGCRLSGIFFLVAGVVISSGGFVAMVSTPIESGWPGWLDTLTAGVLTVLFWWSIGAPISFLGVLVFNYGRRWMSRPARQELQRNHRCPVLYLRSFAHDRETRRTHTMLLPAAVLLPALRTEEEQMARAFGRVGPVIAIGLPGETVPPLGAARLLVTEKAWEPEVSALMAKARLIIIRAGTSPGVLTEMRMAVEASRAECLLLVVPAEYKAYESFRVAAQTIFPCNLPEWTTQIQEPDRQLALVLFGKNWTPALHVYQKRRYSLAPLEGAFRRFLRERPNLVCRPNSTIQNLSIGVSRFFHRGVGLSFAILLSVSLARTIIPEMEVVSSHFRPHIFLAGPLDRFAATMPPLLRAPIRANIAKTPAVRQWVEQSESPLWDLFGSEARLGLKLLHDEDLVDWARVWRENLASKSDPNCAKAVRSLANDDHENNNFIKTLANGTPERLIPTLSKVLLRAADAEFGHAALRRAPDDSDWKYGKDEFLRLVTNVGVERFLKTLAAGPDRSSDADVCWVQVMWMNMIEGVDTRARPVVIDLYLFNGYPIEWRRKADATKQAQDESRERERLRREFGLK